MLSTDVAIAGGGPAGAAAAITLARAGVGVVLFDKQTFPRDKCCGDGLTAGALRRLEHLGLRPESVPSWEPVRDVWVRSPAGRTVEFPLPPGRGTFAAVARRADLDGALVDVARALGVDVRDGHAVTGARPTPGAVELSVAGLGPVTAPFVVAADGMWSPVRKSLGVGDGDGYLGEWHAFRQYFTGVGPAAVGQLWVWFERDLLPGYAWAFPLPGGVANVGFGVHRQGGRATSEMRAQWQHLLERPHIRSVLGPDARPEAPHRAWPIPARVGRTQLVAAGGRVLFAGDAARATDSMTGEGIAQALETGQRAAGAILRSGPSRPESAGERYRSGVRTGLAVDDGLARMLSRVLRTPRGADGALRLAAATDWTTANFARWMFEDYPRAVLATPWRWRRGMLHGPGAFTAAGA